MPSTTPSGHIDRSPSWPVLWPPMDTQSPPLKHRIGFVGAGNMASAIAHGLAESGLCRPDALLAYDLVEQRRTAFAALGGQVLTSSEEVFRTAEVVILAVKPQGLLPVIEGLVQNCPDASPLVISIAAGTSLATLEGAMPGLRVIRTMPNTPSQVRAGVTGICGGTLASEADLALTHRIFQSVGITASIDESRIHALTALSGSGPAYFFAIIEALRDGAVAQGLDAELALTLAVQTMHGAAALLQSSTLPPETLRKNVSSPGGVTLAGLGALQEAGLPAMMARTLQAAVRRDRELAGE